MSLKTQHRTTFIVLFKAILGNTSAANADLGTESPSGIGCDFAKWWNRRDSCAGIIAAIGIELVIC